VSGFAAIFRFDGAPADGEMLGRMVEAIAYRGPDGIARWAGEGVAMAHLMLRTTAESLEETQPLANEDGSLVLVMDGWLANYDELRRDLLARGAKLRTRADAELVLRAFEAWGDDCPRHIDGEYAFVVWDARRREVFCAKDHAGMRPLHYHWDGKRLLVASDMAGVLAAGDFDARPNLGMIAEHLANEWYSDDETLWQGVLRTLPGHVLRAGFDGLRQHRYWMPPLEVSIRYPRDEDYQEHYRELFADCVRRASRSDRPIACEVSGGLDSSAVFGVAQRLLERGALLAPGLAGYTYGFGEQGDADSDELAYARAVGTHFGVEIREVMPFLPELAWFSERGRADRDLAPYPNAAMASAIGRALVAEGAVVGLNGEGGDEFLSTYPFNYAEHLAERDWSSLAQSLREDAAAFGITSAARQAIRYGAGPLVPARLRALRRRLIRPGPRSTVGRRLLSPGMLERLERRRLAFDGRWNGIRNIARRSMFTIMNYGHTLYVHDFLNRNSAQVGYELRSPLYSRRLVEFAFAIPDRQRRRGDQPKHIHVRALAADLPRCVAERKTKAHFRVAFTRVLDNARAYVLARMLRCGIDWIEPAALDEFWSYYDRQPLALKPIYETWAIYGCINLLGESLPEYRSVPMED